MTKLFKAFGATLLAAGLVVAGISGVTAPAHAAALSPTVTATGSIDITGTNAYPLTFTVTPVTAGADQLQIMLPSGWTFVSPPGFSSGCGWVTVTGFSPTSCGGVNNGGIVLGGPSGLTAGTTITVVLPANTFNVGTGRSFSVITTRMTPSFANVDTGSATLSGGVSSYTVTFDANGGSGSMSTQASSSAITLTPNAFTRTDYNFAGWNTVADGTGTAYADAASYPFTANETLYAQWTPILANTGIDAKPYLYGGLALAIVGSALLLIARRKQTN